MQPHATTRLCSIPDCGQKFIAKGYCKAHYYQYIRKPRTPPWTPPTLAERAWAKIEKTPSCWIWRGGKLSSGYGHISNGKGRAVVAHRLIWELLRGPIPEGMQVCHNCPGGDNPSCVRPDHMFLGTGKDNMQDAARKGRTNKGEKCHTARLTADDVRVIRARYATGTVTLAALRREYDVDHSTIRAIVRRKSWQHIVP